MKIEFKKTDSESTAQDPQKFQEVFVNEILEGKFCFDEMQNAFIYTPNLGNDILLSAETEDEARKELIGKLSKIY